MTKQIINIGTSANKGNGDPLRTAFTKVNANFDELYTALGLNADGTLSLGAFEFTGSIMTTTDSTAITIDQSTTVTSNLTVGGDILPSLANGGNLGSLAAPWRSLYVSNNTMYLGGIPLSLDANNNLLVNNQPVTGGGGSSVTTSATAPVGPTLGDLWYDTNSGRTYVYYDSSWVDASPEDGTGTQTDLGDWAFRNDLMYSLNGGVIENSDLTHGATAALTIPTNGDDSPIVLTNTYGNVALVSGASPGALKTWSFGTEGKLTLPAGTTYEYLNAPLTGHGDGLARLDFGLVTDGVSAQWIAATADPAGSGYSPGDTFTFDAEFLGIPGASVTIEVITVGAGGSVEDLAFSTPPRYPADIYRDSPINLQVGPESNRWTFRTGGYLNLPGGTSQIISSSNNVSIEANGYPGGSNLSLGNLDVRLVSEQDINLITDGGAGGTWTFDTTGTLSLPTQPTPIITVNDIVPTPSIYRATDSNDPAAVRSAFEIWYANEQEFEAYRNEGGTGYPWDGLPSWEAYPLIMNYVSGGPGQLPPSPNFAPVAKTAQDSYLAWKELESNIDIQSGNKTFSFENTGSLSLPGELTFTDTTKAKIVVGKLDQTTWTFGVGGSITFPNGSVQTTAYTSTPFDRLVLGYSEVVLGSDGALTIGTGAGKIHTGGVPAADLADFETAYNAAEELYSAELTAWMGLNSHTPAWFTLPGKDAYGAILESNYLDDPQWQGLASLTDRAGNAQNAYTVWQGNILNSKLSVKSDTAIFAFDSTNKLTLSQGGVISGGDPIAIAAADSARIADDQAWFDLITEGGTNLNVRPWIFAGPSRAEKQAVLLAMWTAQNEASNISELGWIPISASFYNQVRAWLNITTNYDGYDNWKKLKTAVNITSEDKTWSFTNDGGTTFPNGVKFDSSEGNTFALDSTTISSINLRDDQGRGFYTDNGGFIVRGNGTYGWTFGTDGKLSLPSGNSVISNLVVAGDLTTGSQIQVGSGVAADTGIIISNGTTNDIDGSVLQAESVVNVNGTTASMAFKTFNSLGAGGPTLTGEEMVEVSSSGVRIGVRVTNDPGDSNPPVISFRGWTFDNEDLSLPIGTVISETPSEHGLYRTKYSGTFVLDPTWFAANAGNIVNSDSLPEGVIQNYEEVETAFSFQYFGYFVPPTSANYTFRAHADETFIFWIGAKALSGYTYANKDMYGNYNGTFPEQQTQSFTIALTAGEFYPIRIQWANSAGWGQLDVFTWGNDAGQAATADFTGRVFRENTGTAKIAVNNNRSIILSTDNATDNNWTFAPNGSLTLPNSAIIRQSTNAEITNASTAYTDAIASWEYTRINDYLYSVNNVPGRSLEGWPFAGWDDVSGTTAAAYLAIVNNAQTIQNSAPSSPPTPLVFTPALSNSLYTQIRAGLLSVINTYAAWQALLTSVDIVAGSETISLLNNNKIQVPGIIQTDVEEDLIIRTRYNGPTSPPGGTNYQNKNFTFGTNGSLTFPDTTVQTTAYVSNITNTTSTGDAYVAPGDIVERNRLRVRTVYTAPNSLNVEFYYAGLGSSVSVTANNGTNIFAGRTFGYNIEWTRFNPGVFVNPGDSATVLISDHSYHKIYRVTAMMRDIPGGDDGSGSIYCTIEELK